MTKSESADGSGVLTTVANTSPPVPMSVGVVNPGKSGEPGGAKQAAFRQVNSPLPVSCRVVGSNTPATMPTIIPGVGLVGNPSPPNIKVKTGPLKSLGLVDPSATPVAVGPDPAKTPVYPGAVGFNGVMILMLLYVVPLNMNEPVTPGTPVIVQRIESAEAILGTDNKTSRSEAVIKLLRISLFITPPSLR